MNIIISIFIFMHFKNYFFLVFCFFKLECADFRRLDMSVREINQAQAWIKNACSAGFPQEINDLRSEVLRILKHVRTLASDFPPEIGSVPVRDTTKWIEGLTAPLTDINVLIRTLDELREMHKISRQLPSTGISQQSLLSDLDTAEMENPLVEMFRSLCLLPQIAEYAEENILKSVPGTVHKLIAYSNSLFPNSEEALYDYGGKIKEKYVDKKIDAILSQLGISDIVPEKVKKNKTDYFTKSKADKRAAMVTACGNICLGYSSRFRDRDILALGDLIDELQRNGLVEGEVVAAHTTFAAAASALRPASQPKSTKSKKGKPKKKRPAAASAAFSGVSAAAAAAEIVVDSDDEASVGEISCKIDDSSFLDATSSSVFETAESPLSGITVVTSVERKPESTTITAPSSTASLSTRSTAATEATEALPSLMKKIQTESPPSLMEQIEALQPTTWLNARDIGFISTIFNTVTGLVNSSDVAAFLKRLVTKQSGSAEYREGRGSHKLAILVSATGKKVFFPFAKHDGRELDRNSRNLIIDGFKELFGFSA